MNSQTIMLHQEWSTLGLLFGMMIIVGELSHTGIFEWLAVRILVSSKGSFSRLMILLCLLTAVASAFLDNVTTMLLIGKARFLEEFFLSSIPFHNQIDSYHSDVTTDNFYHSLSFFHSSCYYVSQERLSSLYSVI